MNNTEQEIIKEFDKMWNEWSTYFILKGKIEPKNLTEGVKQFLLHSIREAEQRGREEVLKEFQEEQKKLLEGFSYKKTS